jgi:hypothetical protein
MGINWYVVVSFPVWLYISKLELNIGSVWRGGISDGDIDRNSNPSTADLAISSALSLFFFLLE